jgi:uncharacterized protein YdcH (DUF465 family)
MEIQPDLLERLLVEDINFKRRYTKHTEYKQKVSLLESRAHLTAAELQEKQKFKKLKLALKDELEEIIAQHEA